MRNENYVLSRRALLGSAALLLTGVACGGATDSGGTATSTAPSADTTTSSGAYGNRVSITLSGGKRIIETNGLPDHATGTFPNRNCPNAMQELDLTYTLPETGSYTGSPTTVNGFFGVVKNGVAFFPNTAEYWNNDRSSGWNYDALGGAINLGVDWSNAHVQPNGLYHYHAVPEGVVGTQDGSSHSPLVGWALDGFPIYARYGYGDDGRVTKFASGWTLKSGTRPSGPGGAYDGSYVADWEFTGNGDLDMANGRYGVTPDYPGGTYYYVLTDAFPYVSRYLMGAV